MFASFGMFALMDHVDVLFFVTVASGSQSFFYF